MEIYQLNLNKSLCIIGEKDENINILVSTANEALFFHLDACTLLRLSFFNSESCKNQVSK